MNPNFFKRIRFTWLLALLWAAPGVGLAQCPQIQFINQIDCDLAVQVSITCGGTNLQYDGIGWAGGWQFPTPSILNLAGPPSIQSCSQIVNDICSGLCTLVVTINGVDHQIGDEVCCNYPFNCVTNNCSHLEFDCSASIPTFRLRKPAGCP